MRTNTFFPEIHGNFGFRGIALPMKGEKFDTRRFRRLTDDYMRAGFNYFDTSHDYLGGESEIAIRECVVKRHPRDSFLLANKLSDFYFYRQEDIRPLFEKQLAWCGVDYFDFYLMDEQNRDTYPKYRELFAYETASALKAEGKIRHLGIAFHDDPEVLDIILTEHPEIEFVQIQFNYLDYTDAEIENKNVYAVCEKHEKPVIATEAVKSGQLVSLPEDADRILRDLNGGSDTSYAIRFAASFPSVALVLTSTRDPAHMKENCSVMQDYQPLSRREMDAIQDVRDVLYSMTEIPCISCRTCIQESICPKQILIPDLFAALNKHAAFRNWDARYSYKNVLTGNGHGKASDCVQCGCCEKVCPEHLDIRKMLRMVEATFE